VGVARGGLQKDEGERIRDEGDSGERIKAKG
jgi:hypothetical protein